MKKLTSEDFTLTVYGPCLSDYWPGHHNAAIGIPVYNGMTQGELIESAWDEYNTVYDYLERDWPDMNKEEFTSFVNTIFTVINPDMLLFNGLEEIDEDDFFQESCYFYLMIN